MQKTPISNLKSSRLYTSATSSLIGVVIMLGVVLLLSVLMSKVDIPEQVVTVMSSISLCIGAYSAGYIASRRRRQNGLVLGMITGVIVYCLVFFLGVMFAKTSITFNAFTKFIMVLICSAIGGVLGVNSKAKRY